VVECELAKEYKEKHWKDRKVLVVVGDSGNFLELLASPGGTELATRLHLRKVESVWLQKLLGCWIFGKRILVRATLRIGGSGDDNLDNDNNYMTIEWNKIES